MRKSKQIDSFTFLRAISIIAISIFHSAVHFLPGGFMAVISFFVLSGFLMMKNLDNRKENNTDTPLFNIKKRLKKLLPSLYFVVTVSLIAALIFSKIIFHDSIKSSLPVIFSFQNLYQILKGGSYFTKNGYFSIFTHFWYISMQVQFILIFYLINYLLDKFEVKNIKKIVFSLISIVSFAVMIVLSFNENNISRIYYGPDARINAIFVGALTYLIVDNFYKIKDFLNKKEIPEKYFLYALLFLTIIVYFFVNGENLYTYRFIMPIYTIIEAIFVGILYTYEKSKVFVIDKKEMGVLSTSLYYIGLRSYYIYMWQFIVNIFISYAFASTTTSKFFAYLFEIALVLVLSEITYVIFNKRKVGKKYFITVIALVLGLNVIANFVDNPKEKDMKDLEKTINQNKDNIKNNNKKYIEEKNKKEKSKEKSSSDKKSNDDKTKNSQAKEKEENKTLTKKKAYDDFDFTYSEKEFLKNLSVTAIGDSVLINVDSYLREFNPNLYLDGEVGRQMTEGPDTLKNIKNQNGLGDIILVSLGSNGSLNDQNLIDLSNISEGRKIFFVNTVSSQSWESSINNQIKKFCDENKNAFMVDWYKYAKEKPDLFAKDMVHPNVEGSKAYRNLIERKILNSFAN